MTKVLMLGGYLPGFKGGGPIQSCVNIVESLSDDFEFYVIASDRDMGDQKPYEGIKQNAWNQIGNAKVFYLSPDRWTLRGFEKILNSLDFDVLYLNGYYSPNFTIKPLILRRIGRLKKCRVILSPRGDFTGGTENKKIKKYSYIYLSKLIGLYKNIIWQATSEIEKKDIIMKFPNAQVIEIPNLSDKFVPGKKNIEKKTNELKLIFISRIFPKKNLLFALEVLKDISIGNVIFDIYGPIEDKEYWNKCKKIIEAIPSNVKITYKGEVNHKEVPELFSQYHAFFFPTLGENYGHVIVEAMLNNCLVVLSKGVTPWDDYCEMLSLGAKVQNKGNFVRIIQRLVSLNDLEIKDMILKNNKFIAKKTDSRAIVSAYEKMMSGEA